MIDHGSRPCRLVIRSDVPGSANDDLRQGLDLTHIPETGPSCDSSYQILRSASVFGEARPRQHIQETLGGRSADDHIKLPRVNERAVNSCLEQSNQLFREALRDAAGQVHFTGVPC